MSATNTDSPQTIAHKLREDAIRIAEENYKKALDDAAKVKETTLSNATATNSEVIKQAKNTIEMHKQRLNESKDKIEFKLRKQELEEVRRAQERLIISSDDNRLKTIKQAQNSYKISLNDAADIRSKAVKQAYDNEKAMLLEAKNRLKAEKTSAKTVSSDKHEIEHDGSVASTNSLEQEIPEMLPAPSESDDHDAINLTAANSKETQEIAIIRSGIIRITVTQTEVNPAMMFALENDLRTIPEIRILMTGGSMKEGYRIMVNSETPVALADKIRQLSSVEDVSETSNEVLIRVKTKSIS